MDDATGHRVTFDAEVWVHHGGSWHFVDLPDDDADDIDERYGANAAGFGSTRVEVCIGSSRWRTSIFPDSKRRTYVLPIKKPIRVAEGFGEGATVTVELTVLG
jgi:hypothetical protein